MNTKSTLFTVLIVQNEYCCTKITKWLLLALIFLPMQTAFAAPCSWGADVMFIEGDEKDEIQFELFGSVSQGIAYCKGYMFGYNEAGTLFNLTRFGVFSIKKFGYEARRYPFGLITINGKPVYGVQEQ